MRVKSLKCSYKTMLAFDQEANKTIRLNFHSTVFPICNVSFHFYFKIKCKKFYNLQRANVASMR